MSIEYMMVICILCNLLLLDAAPRYESATTAFPLKEYRIEIYNTLLDNVRAFCYNSWGQTTSTVITGRSSHNTTFHLPYPWCCDFIWYNEDPRTFFQSFRVSNVGGRVSDEPEIDCGNRCSWRVDFKGFSVFYNGFYRRLYKWVIEGSVYQDKQPNASGLYELTCKLGRLNSNSITFPGNEKNNSSLLGA